MYLEVTVLSIQNRLRQPSEMQVDDNRPDQVKSHDGWESPSLQ